MVIAGLLAAIAIPRFISPSGFQSRTFFDQAEATVRYAQKIAIARRAGAGVQPLVYVVIGASRIQVCYDAGCATPVIDPNTGGALAVTAPSNSITLSPATTFSYGASGAPSAGATITVSSSGVGDINRTFTVDAVTGYVSP